MPCNTCKNRNVPRNVDYWGTKVRPCYSEHYNEQENDRICLNYEHGVNQPAIKENCREAVMDDILQDIENKCKAAKNSLQAEIMREFCLAGINFDSDKIYDLEAIAKALIARENSHGVFINNNQAASTLVRLFRPKLFVDNAVIAINSLGFSPKQVLAEIKVMSKAIQSSRTKKKKNWRTKTIWERVG